MKRLVVLVALMAVAVAPVFGQEAAKQKKVDVTGTWELTAESPQGTMTLTATYKQDGETIEAFKKTSTLAWRKSAAALHRTRR